MKKIFLSFLSMIGIASVLTLSSCGGGGGDNGNLANKTYSFSRNFAVMYITFLDRMGSTDASENEPARDFYEAQVSYKETQSGNTSSDNCKVYIENKTDGTILVKVFGQAPSSLEENAVRAFLGVETEGGDDAPMDTDYEFHLTFPKWPTTTPEVGEIEVISPKGEDDNNDVVEGDTVPDKEEVIAAKQITVAREY